MTSTVLCLKTTVHPFLVSLPKDSNGSTSSVLGNLWHSVAAFGNPWKLMTSVAVEMSWPPVGTSNSDPVGGRRFLVALVAHW